MRFGSVKVARRQAGGSHLPRLRRISADVRQHLTARRLCTLKPLRLARLKDARRETLETNKIASLMRTTRDDSKKLSRTSS
jgi:hypothetical protein